MGLSNFPSPCEGLLPLLVINAFMSLLLVKNLLTSALAGADREYSGGGPATRSVSIRCTAGEGGGGIECSICLCKFKAEEEVSELSCHHFFHKACLDKWFDSLRISCPLCRSIN